MTEQVATVESEKDDRSIGQLVSDLSEQTARLIRTEARLTAHEMSTKARRAALGSGAVPTAGILALYGGGLLLASPAPAKHPRTDPQQGRHPRSRPRCRAHQGRPGEGDG